MRPDAGILNDKSGGSAKLMDYGTATNIGSRCHQSFGGDIEGMVLFEATRDIISILVLEI